MTHLVSSSQPRSLRIPPASHLRPAEAVRSVALLVAAWRRRAQYRRELRRLLMLGPHLVDDIGLLPVHARREAAKPFWRASQPGSSPPRRDRASSHAFACLTWR